MNIYDTAHKLAEEIKRSDECVQLAELRERAYADETNRLLLEEYKRLQVQLQMSMVGAAGEMPSEDMQRLSAARLAAVYEQRRAGLSDGGNADAEDAGRYLQDFDRGGGHPL